MPVLQSTSSFVAWRPPAVVPGVYFMRNISVHTFLWQLVSSRGLSHHQAINKNYKKEALYILYVDLPLYIDENMYICL
jgi:hypothetical protein